MNSSFSRLPLHPRPVNRDALRVGLFPGEHFECRFDDQRPKRRMTFDHPPASRPRPDHAKDYTGERNGRMTAFSWFRPSKSGGATVWVARCDCGRYEFRRPGRWLSHGDQKDMCEVCRREREMVRGGNSWESRFERSNAWVQSLLRAGLSREEVAFVHLANIQTKGRSAASIRADIAAHQENSHG